MSVGHDCKLLKPSGKHRETISKLFESDCSSFPGAAAKCSFAAAALKPLRADSETPGVVPQISCRNDLSFIQDIPTQWAVILPFMQPTFLWQGWGEIAYCWWLSFYEDLLPPEPSNSPLSSHPTIQLVLQKHKSLWALQLHRSDLTPAQEEIGQPSLPISLSSRRTVGLFWSPPLWNSSLFPGRLDALVRNADNLPSGSGAVSITSQLLSPQSSLAWRISMQLAALWQELWLCLGAKH